MKPFTDVRTVLVVGTRLYIAVDSSADLMRSALKAVGSNEMAISIPVRDSYFHPLKVGTNISCYFYQGSGKYEFDSTVSGRIIYEGKPVLKCHIPKNMTRTERRQYYRIDTLFEVRLFLGRFDAKETRIVQEEHEAYCVDISGGGIQLDPSYTYKIPLHMGDYVSIDFCGPLDGITGVKAVVIRMPEGKKNGWGLKFTQISGAHRDKIIKYVFKKQIESRQKK